MWKTSYTCLFDNIVVVYLFSLAVYTRRNIDHFSLKSRCILLHVLPLLYC